MLNFIHDERDNFLWHDDYTWGLWRSPVYSNFRELVSLKTPQDLSTLVFDQ